MCVCLGEWAWEGDRGRGGTRPVECVCVCVLLSPLLPVPLLWSSRQRTLSPLHHHPSPLPSPSPSSPIRSLFLKLAEVGDPESAPLWGGMRDELDTALRLCEHEIRKGGAAGTGQQGAGGGGGRMNMADIARLGSDSGGVGDAAAGGLLQVRESVRVAESESE